MSDLNLPEPPPENQAASGPPGSEPPVKEPRLVYEIAPTPPGYKHTLLWVVGIFALLAVFLCGGAALLISSGALDAVDQLAKSILTPEASPTRNDAVQIPVQPTLPTTAVPAADWKLAYHEKFQSHLYGLNSDWKVLGQAGSGKLDDHGLVVKGKLDAVVDGAGWNNYRLVFKNIDFSKTSTFGIYLRYQDPKNTLKMTCTPGSDAAAGQDCKWFSIIDGAANPIPDAADLHTSGAGVDLEIVVQDDQVQVVIDQGSKMLFTDSHLKLGSAGFMVDTGSNEFTAADFSVTGLPVNDRPGPSLFHDSFMTWDTTSGDDAYATTTHKLDGSYHIQATAKQGFFEWYTTPEEITLPDRFKLSVNAKLVSGPDSEAYGLIFRSQQKDAFYRFIVADNGAYRADVYSNGQLTSLIDWTDISGVLSNQFNTLEVQGDGSAFTLFLNGSQLDSITDSDLTGGSFGIEYSLYDAGDKAEVEFSDLQMWTR